MAGEWIAYDLALPHKPEIQELIDLTGQPVEVVVYRILTLWGWASMHCADGTARMTLPRLVRTCGADEAFWRSVAGVGWLEIDETAATVSVPGWDRRFSQAAKSRAQHADRSRDHEDRNPGRKRREGASGAAAPDVPALERRRGEERREESPPPPREAWGTFREAWNLGKGRRWSPVDPPDGWDARLKEPGWLEVATQAIKRLERCRYFKTPVTLIQFTKSGWAHKIADGDFDDLAAAPGVAPPPKAWKGEYVAAPYRTPKELERLKAGK